MSEPGVFQPVHNSNLDPSKESGPPRLEEIKVRILSLQKDIEKSYLELGCLFLEAKKVFGKRGEWLDWLLNNVDFSICKVERLMRVARWIDKNEAPVPELTFSQAYLLCKLSQKQLEEFGKFVNGLDKVKGMSKRELEAAIRDFLKSKVGEIAADPVSQQTEPQSTAKDDLGDRLTRIRAEVSELANLVDGSSGVYDTFTTELCEICHTIIQRFSSEDAESI